MNREQERNVNRIVKAIRSNHEQREILTRISEDDKLTDDFLTDERQVASFVRTWAKESKLTASKAAKRSRSKLTPDQAAMVAKKLRKIGVNLP